MVLWVLPGCRLLPAAMPWEQGGLIPRREPKAVTGTRGNTAAHPVAVALRYRLAMLKFGIIGC